MKVGAQVKIPVSFVDLDESRIWSGEWKAYAACHGLETPEVFFPPRGASTKKAREICGACPVDRECREYAILTNQIFGVWGGTTGRDRRLLQRRRREALANQNGDHQG